MRTVCVTLLAAAVLALSSLPLARSASTLRATGYAALEGCGATPDRLCLAYPDGCVAKGTCTLMVSVQPVPASNKYHFELAARYSGYVAVALGESELMGSDSVVECIEHPDEHTIKLYQSVNKAYNETTKKRGNTRLPAAEQMGVVLQGGGLQDGVITCTFNRDTVTVVAGKVYDLATGAWYLQAAAGNRINADTSIHHHTEWVVSGRAVKLSSQGLIADSHGSRRGGSGSGARPSSSASAAVLALVAVVAALRAP